MRRHLSVFLAMIMVMTLLFIPAADFAASPTGAGIIPDHVTLTWTDDPATTQTITWRTDTAVKSGIVEYARESDASQFPGNALTVKATTREFSTDLGDINIHTATITGLVPGTRYVYRVGDGTNWSEVFTFTTETDKTDSFKFLIFGDSQSGNVSNPEYGPWKQTVQNAFKANPDAKFIMNMGDFVEQGQNYVHWNNWFDGAKGVIDNVPEMGPHGNHETYNKTGPSSKPVDWLAQFPMPQNGPEGLKGEVFSFDYGDAHFVILDSQLEEEEASSGDIIKVQADWLENDLKNTDKTWKFVFFHKTPYYSKATRTNEYIKQVFQPILDKYHADVVFNGHDHNIARTYPINNDEFVAKPSQGTVYYVTGRSGNKYYDDVSQKVWDAFFYDPQDQPNYLVAEVNDDKFTVTAYKMDGTLIDRYTIDKATDTDNPKTVLPPKYNKTRLVVYGNMLNQPLMASTPTQINGKWYVPLRGFVTYLGCTVDWVPEGYVKVVDGKSTVNIWTNEKKAIVDGKDVSITDGIVNNNGVTMISTDDINVLFGMTSKYDSNTNMLMLTK
ncbi:fibronectin type III domain-containing protein [Calorimonas adulescens]|uniref:Metallophosphoesterase n=1 Tax=Calorimonas adulescens TaxID=2606906 RepID=A0A5D8QBK3_9THEO|nr:fibronectin type III domain-containing protein [Calorimonas adulescens]TZE81524.1 metallophosphoesterase [Calorimonas adulescens]